MCLRSSCSDLLFELVVYPHVALINCSNPACCVFGHLQSQPREWWRQKPPQPLPEDIAAAAQLADRGRRKRQRGSSSSANDDGVPWTSFNDSSTTGILSHDVAWMMEREVQFCISLGGYSFECRRVNPQWRRISAAMPPEGKQMQHLINNFSLISLHARSLHVV